VTRNQQNIQAFVSRDVVPWLSLYAGGESLTQQTAVQFRSSIERGAIAYVEERALTVAVASVLGEGNPAVPFVVLGIKQVLDAETPRAVQLAHQYPEAAVASAFLLLFLLWSYLPEA
jgi:hypothetical protein